MSENNENKDLLGENEENSNELEGVFEEKEKELEGDTQDKEELEGVFDETDAEDEALDEVDKKSKKSKSKRNSNPDKIRNQNFIRRGSYSIAMVAIVLAALVLANVLSTVVAQRLPTTIDVSAERSNKLSADNIKYLKGINQDVTITVCATKAGYTGSEMQNYAQSTYYVQEISTPYNYYNQTITLIELYPKYNSHIKVNYVDPQKPGFSLLDGESNVNLKYGDVVVQCTKKVDGKDTKLHAVIGFTDIYELNQSQSTGTYSIAASNIESKLTGAIYKLVANDLKKVAFLSEYSDYSSFAATTQTLANYSYEVKELKGTISAATLNDYDMIVISKPTNDLTSAQLNDIDTFLNNGGKKGKSLVFLASEASPNLPNLYQFLEEWGISVNDGVDYETESAYRDGDNIRLFNKASKITSSINESDKLYCSTGNLTLSQAFETNGNRTTNILMATSSYAVVAPKGTAAGWKVPADAKKGEIPTVIMTKDIATDEKGNDISSSVTVFASSDFVSDRWAQYTAVGNLEYTVTVLNAMSGRDNANMYFLPKITGTTSMTTNDVSKAILWVSVLIVIPLLIMIGGVLYWIRRVKR